MSSSDFTQRRRQERQVQAAARAEEECAETADEKLDRLLEEMNTPGKEHGEKTGTRSSDSTRRSLTGKGVGERGMALTGAGGSGALAQVVAVRAGAGEQIAQNPAVAEEVARPVSLPPEEPPGLVVVRGKGNGDLLSGLTPGVNSLTVSGVPIAQTPVVARMSEGSREPPVVGNREERQGGKHQSSTEVGGGAAAVVETIALLERPGRSPVESPEDARVKQVVPAAPTSPPVACQPAGAYVVYTATGEAQGLQAAGMSQQSMCAGVPPTGMAPQWETAVVDPGMVTGVMAVEEMNPWSAAKRVEALMSSPQTPVKEPTYPVVSQDLIDQADAREKEKFEELKQHGMEVLQRGKTEIQQDRENWLATREERRALERVQEAGGGHKGSQSSGRSYQTASPEQKKVEQCFPVGTSQGVPPQGQPVQDQTVPGVQHHHDQDLQMKAGGPLWNVPPAPRVESCLRPMDVYMNQGWLNGIPPGGMPQGAASRPPMGAPCMGATENTRHFFIGDQPNQWYNLQAQVGGAPAGQDHRLHGGFAFPGGNTGPMGGYGWPGGPPPGQYGNPGQAPGPPGGHQGNPGQPGGYQGNPGQAVPPQQQQAVVQAGPQAGGEVTGETLRSVELPKLDRNATSLDFGDWLTVVQQMIGDVSYTSAQWWGVVMTAVEHAYHHWLQADPLMRLRMAPVIPDMARGWPRTENRVVGMLLQAVPKDIYEDLVANRHMSAGQVMFKLYTVFQPGGQVERTSLLQMLVDWKGPSNDAAEMVNSIRKWRRWVVRAEELQLVLPDPLVLAGVVAKMSDALARLGGAQAAYRLSSVRQHLGIDLRPGMQEIRTFSELLQAEAGEMALRQPGNTTQGPAAKPNNVVGVKSMSGPDSSGNPPKGASKGKPEDAAGSSTGRRGEKPELPINAANVVHKTACINWLTDKGCQYADRCRFTHAVLDSKDGRCFNCSGKGHSRRDCPAGKRSESRGPQGGSEEPKVAKTTRIRSRSQERENGSGKEGGAAQEHSEPTVKINPMKESTVTITPVPEEANKVVGEVTNLLKGLNGPVLKSVGHGGDHLEVEFDDGTGLLDGGATHPLRQGSTKEIKNAVQVTVELAHGATQLYQNPVNGTLLSEGPVEPIVPLRGLVELGYTITWSRAGCAVKHPRLGKIKCWERSGCPVVRRDHALALITEIERMDTEKRNDRRFTREEANKVSTKISRFKKEPADEPAGGSPVSVQKLTFCVSKVSGQDDQGSGEAPAKEDGSPNSGEFIVRKISLEHQQNWDAEFPSVDPKQDQQMHASRARSTKGIARLEEHQPEEGEHGRNEDLPGKKLVADLLSKIIAVKPNWERFWRFVNRQGSGVPNEEPTIGSNRREEQPLGEEHHPEEPDQETLSWDNYRVIAGRCVSVVKKVVGLAKEYPELAEFRHEALSTAIGRLVQVLADAYRVTENVIKDRFQLESVLPFLEKKNIPGQVEHPVEEEPRGILKWGNRSKRGNSKPKRVHFWDESPPILKVLRVQDHHGHVPQEHSAGKEEPIPKTILGDGQENRWNLDLARSRRKEHRAAEDVPRSGPTEMRDQVAVRGMELLGSVVKRGEIQLHGKPSKGIAPQPMGTQGDQKEKEVRILLQVGTEKEKEELKKDRSPGKVHRWLEKKINKTQGKDH